MIPKVIHYVWVGGNPLTPLAEKCIKSWKAYCPDYEIKRWDESNFDINENVFCKEAYENKKWAFVSDYIRLKVLYEEGGIYMDSDVEVTKSLDDFLKHKAFSGFECTMKIPTGIIASEKHNPWIKLMLEYYKDKHFVHEDGSLHLIPNVLFMTELTCQNYNIKLDNTLQDLDDIVFYPNDFFCPYLDEGQPLATENTATIHHFASSWLPEGYKKEKSKKNHLKSFAKKIIRFFVGKKNYEKIMKKRHEKASKINVNYDSLYEKVRREK
ncbi:MAG: glycosyltransferase family 32 protein [Christensenellales bacterium]